MGRVLKVTIVTKPEQLRKSDNGPYSILLGANLRKISILENKKVKASYKKD